MILTIHLIIYSIALVVVFALWLLNIMYLKEMYKAKRIISIEAPPLFIKLLKAAIGLSVGTIVTIVFFILYELINT